jgi:cell division protein FtsA
MRKIMAALDVGGNEIKLIVGEMVKTKLNVLGISTAKTQGMKHGTIIDENKVLEALTNVFNNAESRIGIKINKVIVIVPSKDAEFTIGEGTIKIDSEDQVITGDNISRVLMESTSGVVQDNMELITSIPTSFRLDNNVYSKDPKGSISSKLGVRSVIITSPKAIVYPILSLLEKLNIDVVDISFDAIGDYYTFKNQNIENKIGAVVNIGDNKTTLSVFNKGILTNISNIYIGGENIDNDLSYVYKLTNNVSCKLKESFGLAHTRFASQSDEMEVINRNGDKLKINQYEVSEVINSRLKEILETAKKEINHLTKKDLSYIIFTGGTTEIQDFNLVMDEVYGKKAVLGRIEELGARNNKYSSALGLIRWYNELEKLKDRDYSIFSIDDQEVFSKIQDHGKINDNTIIGKVFGYFFDN